MEYIKIGEGSPVVWLHGWGCDGSIFLPVTALLPNHANYLVDFAGFGKSAPPPPEGWSVVDYAQDLHLLLQQLGLGEVVLVGHSFGCRVALVLAAMFPQDVARMLLVAPAGLRRFSLKRSIKVLRYKLSKRLGHPQLGGASSDWLACDTGLKTTFVKVVTLDLSRYAKRVRCQVLIVNGRQDNATPLWHAKRLHKLISNSSLVELDGGHFAFFEAPRAFAETVKIFAE